MYCYQRASGIRQNQVDSGVSILLVLVHCCLLGDLLYSIQHLFYPVLEAAHIASNCSAICFQTGLDIRNCAIECIECFSRPSLLLFESCDRALELGGVSVQGRKRPQACKNMRYVRQRWREARKQREDSVLSRGKHGQPVCLSIHSLLALLYLTGGHALQVRKEQLESPRDGIDVPGLSKQRELVVEPHEHR